MAHQTNFDCKNITRNYDVFRWEDAKNPQYGKYFSVPELAPNSDIAGIGVSIAFLVPGYIITILVIVHYLMVPRDHKSLNALDRYVRELLHRQLLSDSSKTKWKTTLDELVLSLSDQQIVTGIGIIACGMYELRSGISAYHWQLVIYLAWFSSTTHLGGLTILGDRLGGNKTIRRVRILFMCVLALLLIAALLPTASGLWVQDDSDYTGRNENLAVPTICIYRSAWAVLQDQLSFSDFSTTHWNDKESTKDNAYSLCISVTIICLNYAYRVYKIRHSGSDSRQSGDNSRRSGDDPNSNKGILQKFEQFCIKYIQKFGRWSRAMREHKNFILRRIIGPMVLILNETALLIFLSYLAIVSLLGSLLFEILSFLFAVAWGSSNFFASRSSHDESVKDDQNDWSYGQILACFLLIIPFLSTWESSHKVLNASTSKEEPPKPAIDPMNNSIAPTASVLDRQKGYKSNPTIVEPETFFQGSRDQRADREGDIGLFNMEDRRSSLDADLEGNASQNLRISSSAVDKSENSPQGPSEKTHRPLDHLRHGYNLDKIKVTWWFSCLQLWLIALALPVVILVIVSAASDTLRTSQLAQLIVLVYIFLSCILAITYFSCIEYFVFVHDFGTSAYSFGFRGRAYNIVCHWAFAIISLVAVFAVGSLWILAGLKAYEKGGSESDDEDLGPNENSILLYGGVAFFIIPMSYTMVGPIFIIIIRLIRS